MRADTSGRCKRLSQEKIEAIILADDGIMIQEITFMRSTGYQPVLKVPTVEEIVKVTDGCSATLRRMKNDEVKKENAKSLLDMIFGPYVEKYGRENVTINEDMSISVNDNGVMHRVWVE